MKKQASFQCYFFLRTIIFVCLSSLCMISPIAHGIIYSNLQTQNDHFARFIHFTTQDGLCSNQILDIAQDKFGKIWFATQNGLTCFDGFHYNIYRNNIEQSNSISDNTITALTIDSDGNLWAGTQDGLNKFDYTTRTFTRYYTDKQQKNSLRSNHIKALYADKEGFLWIESAGGFLSRLNLKTQEWNHVSHTSLPTEGNYFYHHIFEDSNHNIWVGGRLTHIALIPGKEMKAIRHPIQNKDEVYFDPGCFVETAGKELLCSNYEGALGCYNPDSGFFHTILQIPVGATSAVRDDDGKIWIGGDLRGLIRIDFENQIYHNFQNNPQDNNTLLSNNVSCLYKDRDGNIWIGTDKGVSMYAHKYNSIRHYRKIPDANSPVSDHITALLQDHNGLIWVGTESEGVDTFSLEKGQFGNLTYNLLTKDLSPATFEREKQTLKQYFRHGVIQAPSSDNESVFDNYRSFKNTPLQFANLNENNISALYEDKASKIYIGLWSHIGFNIYDKANRTFNRYALWSRKPDYLYPPLIGNPFGANWYTGFLEDSHSRFWCVTWECFGLNLFDRQQGKFLPKHYARNSFPRANCWIYNSGFDSKAERLYLAGTRYYGYYDLKKQDFVQIGGTLPPNYPNRDIYEHYFQYCKGELINLPPHFREINMLYDKKRHIWLTGHNFVARHTLETQQVEILLQFDKEVRFTMSPSQNTESIYLGKNNELYLLNGKYAILKGKIPHDIKVMHLDRKNELWMGTDSGLFIYNPLFDKILPFSSRVDSFPKITALSGDSSGNLYIGTSSGVICLKNKKQTGFYPLNSTQENSLPGHHIYHINCEQPGFLWISTNEGLARLHLGTKEMTVFTHDEMNPNSIPSSLVVYTFFGPDGNLWVSTSAGMAICNMNNQAFTDMSVPDSSSLSSRLASCIIEDKRGNIWLGTTEKGINVLNIRTDKIKHYPFHPWNTTGIPNNTINCLFEDSRGHIWVGTEKGLCQYNSPEDNFTRIKGLSDYIIKSIQEDSRQYLWVATGNGLFCLTADGEIFRRFGKQHGFQDDEFTSASCRLRNGSLLFGGMHGFNLFDPSDFTEQVMPSPILFSNFKVKDKVCQTDIAPAGKIDLSYKENSFSIDFCALDFVDGPHLKYRYRLSGFDKNAIQTVPPFLNAKYTNIPPGDYTFEVEVCNRFGEWKNRQTFCFIHISTPWYRQFWFICLLIAFLGTSIYMLIRYRERKLRLNGIRLEKLIAKRTQALSEAIDSKNKFFSIISHDLKNPIQSLQLVAHNLYQRFDQMQDVEKRTILRIIDETSGQTKMLLDNLLLWELSQQEILLPNYKKTELSKVTDTVMQTCLLTANKKNIRLINRIPPGIWVLTDSNMLETILHNLTGNAIKYSYPDSQIEINSQQDNNKIVVMVTDHGIGISEENQSNLFRPENKLQTKGTSQEQGNGLGLIIVQELLSKMGETIQVNSSPGRGSIFTFTLQKYSGT